ncbi:MAG: hypothetical protein ACXU7D_05175, partial [Burkholderiaceae bacterium]
MCRKNKSASLAWTRSIVAGLLGATLLLSGCGSLPPQQNARIQQAIQSNQLGESAYYAGDYARAL